MSKLILIKHAAPEVDPNLPPERWKLSDKGRLSCATLADRLRINNPQVIISSVELKAAETAESVGTKLNIPIHTASDLHEHDRGNVPHMRSGEFISLVELFFRRPDELVLGRETARQATLRISQAIETVMQQYAAQDSVAVVSHGTVIALLLAAHSDRAAFQLWREMALPSFAVLEMPDFQIREIVSRI